MKIVLVGKSAVRQAVQRKMELQGTEVVEVGGPKLDVSCAELPRILLEATGVIVSGEEPTHFVTKHFEHGQWNDQTMVGVPLRTLMNDNLGPKVDAGCGMRFVDSTKYNNIFDSLSTLALNGFTSIGINENGLTSVWSGVPFRGIFNVLESVRGKIEDFVMCPSRLFQTWTVSVLMTKSPFPFKETTESYQLENLTSDREKHFWPVVTEEVKGCLYTTSTIAGWSTAYGTGSDRAMADACERALTTARFVRFQEKQYRTDFAKEIGRVWRSLQL